MADKVLVGKKARSGYKRKRPKRFMRRLEPSESIPGPFRVYVSPVPVPTARSKKIALEALNTSI